MQCIGELIFALEMIQLTLSKLSNISTSLQWEQNKRKNTWFYRFDYVVKIESLIRDYQIMINSILVNLVPAWT